MREGIIKGEQKEELWREYSARAVEMGAEKSSVEKLRELFKLAYNGGQAIVFDTMKDIHRNDEELFLYFFDEE